ncbi:MAG: ATP synthase F1 subunit delta [Deltaproteobacteria bacterium]|nr:ATP synthase F1 subunit delta [Deltaproteobacteria bacterium]
MKARSLARRYAKALIGIAIDQRCYEEFAQELATVAKLFKEHTVLSTTLMNPSYTLAKRKAVMEGVVARLKSSKTVRNFLLLTVDRGRVELIPDIAVEYQALADEEAGRVRADVRVAADIDLQDLDKLKAALEKRTGKEVVISARVDPTLIAGKVTRIGSTVLDGSVSMRLELIRNTLLEGKL